MKEHGLSAGSSEGDNGTSAYFAAGPRGGRNRDKRRESGPLRLIIELRKIQLRPLHQQARRFAGVQRTASTNGDDTIALIFHKGLRCLAHVLLDGIWMHARVKEPGLALIVLA